MIPKQATYESFPRLKGMAHARAYGTPRVFFHELSEPKQIAEPETPNPVIVTQGTPRTTPVWVLVIREALLWASLGLVSAAMLLLILRLL